MSDPVDHLPGEISAVTTQKKNSKRYSIFVDDVFLLGVAESTLLDYSLKKGSRITTDLYHKLQRAEGRHAVKSYVLKLLSRRAHARKELLDKARRKDYPSDVIHSVLDELEQKGFIKDQEFAAMYAREKSNLNRWGPYKISTHLRKKGVPKETSEWAIDEAFNQINLKERFYSLIDKHKRRFLREKNALKRKKKVLNYLLRKGYRSQNIYKHIDGLLERLKE